MKKLINEKERLDEIGFGNLRLLQKPEDFCYGIDAVLLADFASTNSGQYKNVAELGTGNGVISILLNYKKTAEKIIAFEVQDYAADLAKRNVELNEQEEVIKVRQCDILDIEKELWGSFECVVTNPPYMTGGCGIQNSNKAKTVARHETTASLEDFMQAAENLLCDKGELFMVHRPWRLVDIIASGRENNLEAKIMRLVSPQKGKAANIVLIKFVKNGGKELKILPELYVRNYEGKYTREIDEIYERI